MDEQLLDAMCSRLKPVLYAENSFIFREGDPVDEMLFIMKGDILTMTTNGGTTSLFNSVYLMAGDFCGEELLTWALDHNSSSSLPISARTVQAVKDVEAFCLIPDDLKCVMSQFRRVHGKQLQHTFRQVLFPVVEDMGCLFYTSSMASALQEEDRKDAARSRRQTAECIGPGNIREFAKPCCNRLCIKIRRQYTRKLATYAST
ncbi:UNVERIFIED_CONTAM: Cyclic nucleotide-gated ion channel 1 [Sesamum radiatum]|uniref:Cyclic nucleotide-gated ion channel 1 n=1 Tax=Sesamum radiatum TaxID=300843 RepID=A0AAW2NBA8_SESRA